MAATGVAGAGYAALKRNPEPVALWSCLLYFSSMEALQAASYLVLNQCANPANQVLTLFGYLHITFQPFFINGVALYFMPKDVASRVAPWAYTACFAAALIMLLQLYPFSWAGVCEPGHPLCGKLLCTVRGQWHVAWFVPFNGIGDSLTHMGWLGPSYILTAFVLPALYGSWRLTLFTYLAGPFAASLTTSNVNEWPAVWCLFSIGLCLTIIKTPLRRHLYIVTPYWRIAKLLRRKANASESNIPVNDSDESNRSMAELAETAQTPPQVKS
ncbi:MAG: DUF5765 domain-containing protein [Beijerinckiaceae bacterium]|nr:DUF5765 domain-containing protein [Beijerinckiaceae bacterium]